MCAWLWLTFRSHATSWGGEIGNPLSHRDELSEVGGYLGGIVRRRVVPRSNDDQERWAAATFCCGASFRHWAEVV